MKIEKAYANKKFIGYRLTIEGQPEGSFLVWADQSVLIGLRRGDGFAPNVNETIEYRECELVEKAGAL